MLKAKACAIGLLCVLALGSVDANAQENTARETPQKQTQSSFFSRVFGSTELANDSAVDSGIEFEKDFNGGLSAWQVRDYKQALAIFSGEAFDGGQSDIERARAAFWAARAANKLRDHKLSEGFLETVASKYSNDFYGQLASKILRRELSFSASSFPRLSGAAKDAMQADEALVHAIIKQESRFNRHAKSPAGARGLMQLMPDTARHIDKVSFNSVEQLSDEAYNVRLGSTYVNYLAQKPAVNNNPLLLLAAYNNGPHAMQKWVGKMPEGVVSDPLLLVESYPVGETRNFMRKVMSNLWVYDRILNDKTSASLEKMAKSF